MMRQAGRCLPEYRALKEKYSFVDMVRTPDLAAEVTLQPVRRFSFDAAVLFSDILVVPEGLGQSYRFREEGGIEMEFAIRNEQDIDRLNADGLRERLQYTSRALGQIRAELNGQCALLGFSGSPWTLANYMMEGGSVRECMQARQLFHNNPRLFERLLEKLTLAVTDYLELQIEAGVDAVQIFDSIGGILPPHLYDAASGNWISRVISGLMGKVPVILFSRGTAGCLQSLIRTGAQILSLDWSLDLSEVRRQLPKEIGIQGNLDPVVLTTTPEVAASETIHILESMRGFDRFIFNLGHGVTPQAQLENIESVVATVRDFQ